MAMPRILACWTLGACALLAGWTARADTGADAAHQAQAAYQAAQGDPAQLKQALELASQALHQTPDDATVRLLRADIQTALRRYPQALKDYQQLPDAGLPAERKMMQCLLRERVQPAPLPLACYAEAGQRFAAEQAAPQQDPNYVMTQLLAQAPDADRMAAELLAATPAGPQREINTMLFKDFDRTHYVQSVLP